MHQRNKEKGICLNPKVTNLQANVEEGQANVGKELEELREVVGKWNSDHTTKCEYLPISS